MPDTLPHIRWFIRRDLPEVMGIERASFGDQAWTEDDFVNAQKRRNVIGMVAEDRKTDAVIGYMIYELHRCYLYVLNFAVKPEVRRCGVGRTLVEKLINKLAQNRRAKIAMAVREANLPAHLFWAAMGFRATGVLRNFYEDIHEDAYSFEYALPDKPSQAQLSFNRITRYVS